MAGLILADAYYQAYRIVDPLEGIRLNLSKARNSLSHGKVPLGDPFAEATRIAEEAEVNLEQTRFTFRLVGSLPILGRPMFAIRQQVSAAGQWALAATEVRDMVSDLLGEKALRGTEEADRGSGAPVFNSGKVNLKLINGLPVRLERLIAHLERAESAIRAIPSIPFYPRLQHIKENALEESREDIALARNALSSARLLPSFLGDDRPRRYFLALQNNSDLRGTGGAVLAYAFLVIDDGAMSLEESGRIGDLDDRIGGVSVPLSEPVFWYIREAGVAPRLANGANYSPNMPVVGRAWADMIEKITGKPIDGAIAMDPIAVAQAMGSRRIRIRSYPDAITGENAVKVIENDQYRLPKEEQQVFPGELIGRAWQIFRSPRPFVKTLQDLADAFRTKNIQIWAADPDQQALLSRLRWNGALLRNPGGYLYLVDNKRVANKVDYYSYTDIDYRVSIGGSSEVRSTYTVTLTNKTPPDQDHRIVGTREFAYALNRAMMSLYVPKSARFESVDPVEAPEGYSPDGFREHIEQNWRVFTQTIDSTPGDPGALTLRYSVPGAVREVDGARVYQLTVQHQPLLHPATFTATITLPEGAEVVSAPGWRIEGRTATFETTLTRDLVTQVVFE